MARENITRFICDRCKKTIEEIIYENSDDEKLEPKPVVYIESTGMGKDEPIRFDEICTPCKDRVTALLDQIALTKPVDDKGADDKGADDKGADK